MDIASEELNHMEMVATAINMLNGHDPQAPAASVGNIEAHVLTGLNPMLTNASGELWTAAYVNVTGDLPADLLSNIAAEQRAKVVYEYLHRQINDKHVQQMIDFLLNREEAHNTMFRECFQKIEDTSSNRDWGVDKDARLYFNLSTPEISLETSCIIHSILRLMNRRIPHNIKTNGLPILSGGPKWRIIMEWLITPNYSLNAQNAVVCSSQKTKSVLPARFVEILVVLTPVN